MFPFIQFNPIQPLWNQLIDHLYPMDMAISEPKSLEKLATSWYIPIFCIPLILQYIEFNHNYIPMTCHIPWKPHHISMNRSIASPSNHPFYHRLLWKASSQPSATAQSWTWPLWVRWFTSFEWWCCIDSLDSLDSLDMLYVKLPRTAGRIYIYSSTHSYA